MIWHVLDVGSIWVKEFTSALKRFVPALGWAPVMRWAGILENWERVEEIKDPRLPVRYFPLQRSYHRFPVSAFVRLGAVQTGRMSKADEDVARSPLICTTPYYAEVAEKWGGPVVYYQTDLTYGYATVNPASVLALDRRMCRVAAAVCPNSRRLGTYMVELAGCDPSKITVIPNATRESNVLSEAPSAPGPLPQDVADLRRPVIGVLGNLAGNLNWSLLQDVIDRTPQFSWLLVGPTDMAIEDRQEAELRRALIQRGGRVRFAGPKPYGELQAYARSFDAAVLPYRRKEPTYSGSSTRFYEHLAACRPMVATRGFEELLRKVPLLDLADTVEEIAGKLEGLAQAKFSDGLTYERWLASRQGTWENRALGVIEALVSRWAGTLGIENHPEAQHRPEDNFQAQPGDGFELSSIHYSKGDAAFDLA